MSKKGWQQCFFKIVISYKAPNEGVSLTRQDTLKTVISMFNFFL